MRNLSFVVVAALLVLGMTNCNTSSTSPPVLPPQFLYVSIRSGSPRIAVYSLPITNASLPVVSLAGNGIATKYNLGFDGAHSVFVINDASPDYVLKFTTPLSS